MLVIKHRRLLLHHHHHFNSLCKRDLVSFIHSFIQCVRIFFPWLPISNSSRSLKINTNNLKERSKQLRTAAATVSLYNNDAGAWTPVVPLPSPFVIQQFTQSVYSPLVQFAMQCNVGDEKRQLTTTLDVLGGEKITFASGLEGQF